MLKFNITKTEYDELSEDIKKLYNEKGDLFQLDTDVKTQDDTGELRRANVRLKQERDELKGKVLDNERQSVDSSRDIEKIIENKTKVIGDLKTSYESKLEELQKQLQGREGSMINSVVDRTVTEMAHTLSKTSPSILIPHIKSRLKGSMNENGDVDITVLDKSGKPDVLSNLESLKKEFLANKEFNPILVVSGASGGGTVLPTNPIASGGGTITSVKDFKGDIKAEIAFKRSDPEAYANLKDK